MATLVRPQPGPGGQTSWQTGFTRMAAQIGAALGDGPAVSPRTELFRPLPDDPMAWLLATFPTYFQNARGAPVPLAPHHAEFWAWVWALRPGDPPPYDLIAIWARGGGKSTSLEVASAVIGYFGLRRYALYICHAAGTPIYDPALGQWMAVEEHPTAMQVQRDGVEITIAGLPFAPEVVTPEHQYWARRIARRDLGHGKPVDILYGRAHWIEAQDLDWHTWIGYPIDLAEDATFPPLSRWSRQTQRHEPWDCPWLQDPEWWWLFGLWWGDGTLGGAGNAQIAISCATQYPEIRQRLLDCLDDAGLSWHEAHPGDGSACSSISFCHSALARWLQTWRAGRNRKQPPAWVERLPLVYQRALLRGYCDADGSLSDRGMALTSIHLPGLLAVRRMLMRLGIPSYLNEHKRQRDFSYHGRVYKVQPKYALRLADGLEGLGYAWESRRKDQVRDLFIQDGCLWSRVRDLDVVHHRTFVPIQTRSHTYYTHCGLSHNCDTKTQADDHVSNVATLLEVLGVGRAMNRYGFSRGWNINRLTTADGYTQDAIGMDAAIRGVKRDEARPDLIFLDELDGQLDTLDTITKKEEVLTRSILPAGADSLAVVGVQNIPHKDGIFAKLADGRAEYLFNRVVSGPHPALRDLPLQDWYVREMDDDGRQRLRLVGGTPVWAGQDREACEIQLNRFGSQGFLIECQHLIAQMKGTVFQREWFQVVGDWPRGASLVRYWDFAATEEPGLRRVAKDPDWTVGVLMALWRGQFWVVDMQRVRRSSKGVEDLVRQTAAVDGPHVAIWLEEEGGASGKTVTADYRQRILVGYNVHTWHVTGSKGERVKNVSSAAEAGNVFLVQAPWTHAFLDEIGQWGLPGVHDDIADALSGAHYALTLGGATLPSDFSLATALAGMGQKGMEARAQTAALLPALAALYGVGDEVL